MSTKVNKYVLQLRLINKFKCYLKTIGHFLSLRGPYKSNLNEKREKVT